MKRIIECFCSRRMTENRSGCLSLNRPITPWNQIKASVLFMSWFGNGYDMMRKSPYFKPAAVIAALNFGILIQMVRFGKTQHTEALPYF